LIFGGDVRFDRRRFNVGASNVIHDGIRGIITRDVIHNDICPRLTQGKRNAPADTGIGAGYQGFLSDQHSLDRKLGYGRFGLG
jgi:hypothetical protein